MWYIMWYTGTTTINQNFIDSVTSFTRYEIYAEMCKIRVTGFRYLDTLLLK